METEGTSRQVHTIVVAAKPEPITIEPASTAAIVVDMQNDFCTKGGMFERAGIDYLGSSSRRSTLR